jgi:hypothetical protein
MQVFRLEDSQNQLPLHWAYNDADTSSLNDGFQVWDSIGRVVAVATGTASADGEYNVAEYPYIHLITVDASDLEDGCDEWFAVPCQSVKADAVITTVALIEWCKFRWAEDVADGYDAYEDDFESWCADSESEILEWAQSQAQSITPVFVETLV